MKKILFSIILFISVCTAMQAVPKAQRAEKIESLKYEAYWHWGFIWKLAGSGSLTLWKEQMPDSTIRMHSQVCGRSLSIVETIMKVRDTLDSYYTPELIPIEYCKKTNEGSYQAVERNYYQSYIDGKVQSNISLLKRSEIDSTHIKVQRWRSKKGSDSRNLSNDGVGFDMLSIFYELRNLDYDHMTAGTKLKYRITSGIKNRGLNIHYKGKTTCTLKNGKKYPAHRVELTFESKDSDSTPLQVWVAATPDHRPLSIIIHLKRIGSVQGEIVE